MGNRGRLHEGRDTREVVRAYQNQAWITCVLSFKDRQLPQWHPHHYTPLFFFDEAVALAAGHRPCAECRRADYNAYRTAWAAWAGGPAPSAPTMDARLHDERRPVGAARPTHVIPWAAVPGGTFVVLDDGLAVVAVDRLRCWDGARYGYGATIPRPIGGSATVLTPPSNVAVLTAGYPVQAGSTPP